MLGVVPYKQRNGVQSSSGWSQSPFGSWPMERLFDRFFEDVWGGQGTGGGNAGIRVEMNETEDRVVIRAEVPGIAPDALDISLTGDVLTLTGEKQADAESYTYSERTYGRFHRALRLPCPVEPDQVEARHEHGLVTVTLQKAEAVRPKRIRIESK